MATLHYMHVCAEILPPNPNPNPTLTVKHEEFLLTLIPPLPLRVVQIPDPRELTHAHGVLGMMVRPPS